MFIGEREIGPGAPVFVIAEAGVNHDGRLDLALRLVDAAAEAGADGVKFQTFRAERLASRYAPKARYQQAAGGSRAGQMEMLRELELSPEDFQAIQARCRERGLVFLSTPFDEESLELLERMEVPAFKAGSGEITNLPFIRSLARRGKPLLLSTGMATLEEVAAAVDAFREAGGRELLLFHCTSSYPAPHDQVNLRAMVTLRERFGVPVGYSDHTLGIAVAVAAVALGACAIEKHLTLDRGLPGPDHRASLEPPEFSEMVKAIRAVEAALGDGVKRPAPCEVEMRAVARKSVVATRAIPAGALIGEDALAIKRPGVGIPPADLPAVIGRRAAVDIAADEVLTWDKLA